MTILSADDLSRIPAEPPRRPDLLPGLWLSRAVPTRLLVILLVPVAFMAAMPVLLLTQTREGKLALGETERAAGRVESAEAGPGCGGSGTDVSFSFTSLDGLAFRGRQTVCAQSPYVRIQPGDSVPVVYVKSNPEVSAIAETSDADAALFAPFLVFPFFALVFFVPLVWPRLSQLLRDRKLFRTGTLARGRVRFVARQHDAYWPGWPAPTRGAVYVAARLPSGEEREVKAVCTNDWLLTHMPPGSEVTVCVEGDRAVLLENYLR